MWFTKKQQGAISVFLVLILLSTFLFAAVVVDGGRIYAGRNIVSGAGQLALNAGLSDYDVALKDAYGLIAMSETPEELQKNLHNYFVDSLSSVGISEENYSKALVFLELASEDSFHSVSVPNTEIWRGQVMEQQVLDYMKYRAPITAGMGILDKLSSVKDMNKVKKVADDQIQTAKAAEDIQKLLEDLKEFVDDEREVTEEFSNHQGQVLEELSDDARRVTAGETVVYAYQQCNEMGNAGSIEGVEAFIEAYTNLERILNNTSEPLDKYCNAYDPLLELKKNMLSIEQKFPNKDSFMEEWKAEYGLDDEGSSEDASSDDEEENKDDMNAEMLREGENLYEQYKTARDQLKQIPNSIASEVDVRLSDMQVISEGWYQKMQDGIDAEQKIIKQIDKIESKLKNLTIKVGKWKEDSDMLLTGEALAEMKEQDDENRGKYEVLIDYQNQAGIGVMKSYAETNKDYFVKDRQYFDKQMFANVKLLKVNDQKRAVKDEIDSHLNRNPNGAELRSYVKSEDFLLLTLFREAEGGKFVHEPLKDLTDTDFYRYLEEVVTDKGKKNEKEEIKQASNETKGKLEDFLKELKRLMLTDDLKGISGALSAVQESLPSYQIETSSQGESKSVDHENVEDFDKSSKRKKSLDDASRTLNTEDSILNNMEEAASLGDAINQSIKFAEPVYLTEYIMNMYSYYTIDKTGQRTSDGKWGTKAQKDLLSLSDYALYEDVIYRAEVEYILWGNRTDVSENVGTTKAVIFAIQFIGNLSYALTQKIVTDGAKELGSFFPNKFVSLVVQVVAEIVVATVETVRDMVVLMNGGSVVPFKILTDSGTKKEWRTKFQHVTDIQTWDMTGDKSASVEHKLYAFSYRDYLWLICCIKCMDNQGKTKRYSLLTRAADLSQVNLAKSENKKDYSLLKEFTMLKIDADVKLDAWLVTDLFNTPEVGLDTSGQFTLRYKGIQGY